MVAKIGEPYILLCEEIREEKKETKIIIGVFPPGGIRGNLPVVLPKFGIFMSSPMNDDLRNNRVILKIETPSGKTVIEAKDIRTKIAESDTHIHLALNISPIAFNEFGEYSIRLFGAGGFNVETKLNVQPSLPVH